MQSGQGTNVQQYRNRLTQLMKYWAVIKDNIPDEARWKQAFILEIYTNMLTDKCCMAHSLDSTQGAEYLLQSVNCSHQRWQVSWLFSDSNSLQSYTTFMTLKWLNKTQIQETEKSSYLATGFEQYIRKTISGSRSFKSPPLYYLFYSINC